MEHYQSDELIDAYILNELSAPEQAMIRRRISSDPDFAGSVREHEEMIHYLEGLRDKQIREQLKTYDEEESRRVRPRRRLLFAAVVLSLLSAGFWFFQTTLWEPENIARRQLLPLHEGSANADVSPDTRDLLNNAAEAFDKSDYQEAARIFHHLAQQRHSKFAVESKWNLLICHLAIEGPNERWMEEMRKLTDQAPEPLHTQGLKLIELFSSPFYKIFSIESDSAITALKPRLI